MDFIKQLKAFDEIGSENLTPNAIAIYYHLFMVNNRCGWKEWFDESDFWIGRAVGIRRRETILAAINLLKQKGFIDFQRGSKRNQSTSYKIIELSTRTIFPHENSAIDSAKDSAEHSAKHSAKDSPKHSAKDSPKHSAKDSGNIKQETETKTETETKQSSPARKKFVPPTLEEVNEYVLEKNLHVSAKDFLDYFTESNWVDSKGNKVNSWKGKILTWEKYRKPDQPQRKTRLQENMEAADRAIAFFESQQEAIRNDEGNGDSQASQTVYGGVPF
jgi:hypothetical protein